VIFFILAGLHSVAGVLIAFRDHSGVLRRRLRHDALVQRRLLRHEVSGPELWVHHHGLGRGRLVGPYIAGAVKDRTGSYSER